MSLVEYVMKWIMSLVCMSITTLTPDNSNTSPSLGGANTKSVKEVTLVYIMSLSTAPNDQKIHS